jgi:hypothetical protein
MLKPEQRWTANKIAVRSNLQHKGSRPGHQPDQDSMRVEGRMGKVEGIEGVVRGEVEGMFNTWWEAVQ